MAGRPGNEQRRANPKDIFSMRATWPFHLARDFGASLFGQRAWLAKWPIMAQQKSDGAHDKPEFGQRLEMGCRGEPTGASMAGVVLESAD